MNESTHRVYPPPENPPEGERRPQQEEALAAQLLKQLHELWDYLGHYVIARRDLARAIAWRTAWQVGIGLAAALGVAGLVIAAGWFLLNGLAGGLAAWLGPLWLGQLLAGSVVLVGVGALVWFASRHWAQWRLKRIRRKYEQREAHQQNTFGRSVGDFSGKDAPDRGGIPAP